MAVEEGYEKKTGEGYLLTEVNDIETFMVGGNAYFTLENVKTGHYFTYRVRAPKEEQADGKKVLRDDIYFCHLLTGPDNSNSYTYIGYMKYLPSDNTLGFTWGNKSPILKTAPAVDVLTRYVNDFVRLGKLPKGIEFWHEGKCCRCGRKLTVPESIENGIGPECAKNMGL